MRKNQEIKPIKITRDYPESFRETHQKSSLILPENGIGSPEIVTGTCRNHNFGLLDNVVSPPSTYRK